MRINYSAIATYILGKKFHECLNSGNIPKTHAKTEYDDMIKSHGIKDNINEVWVERYKQGGRPREKEMIDELE